MHQHVLLYIKQGLEAYQKAFSPVIIIEDQYLQTFVHTLLSKGIESLQLLFLIEGRSNHCQISYASAMFLIIPQHL